MLSRSKQATRYRSSDSQIPLKQKTVLKSGILPCKVGGHMIQFFFKPHFFFFFAIINS